MQSSFQQLCTFFFHYYIYDVPINTFFPQKAFYRYKNIPSAVLSQNPDFRFRLSLPSTTYLRRIDIRKIFSFSISGFWGGKQRLSENHFLDKRLKICTIPYLVFYWFFCYTLIQYFDILFNLSKLSLYFFYIHLVQIFCTILFFML